MSIAGNANSRFVVVPASDEIAVRYTRRAKLEGQVILAADLDEWRTAIQDHFGAIGLLELKLSGNAKKMSDRLKLAHGVRSSLANALIFAIGKDELRLIEPELLISGFAGVFCSNSELGRLEAAISQHWNSLCWPKQSLEHAIERNLPWELASGNREKHFKDMKSEQK